MGLKDERTCQDQSHRLVHKAVHLRLGFMGFHI